MVDPGGNKGTATADGAGWNAHVIDYNSRLGAALIAYTDATTPRGVPYEDVHLQLHALRPA